jgi:hypothetical protein
MQAERASEILVFSIADGVEWVSDGGVVRWVRNAKLTSLDDSYPSRSVCETTS